MGSFVYRISTKFLITFVGILFIGSLPALFDGVQIDIVSYFSQLKALLPELVRPWEWTYIIGGFERDLFPKILDPWSYSLTLLFVAFFIAFFVALLLAYITMLLPRRIISGIKFVLFSLESLPDVLIIAMFQIGVIWLYQKTGYLMFYIASMEIINHIRYQSLPLVFCRLFSCTVSSYWTLKISRNNPMLNWHRQRVLSFIVF